MNNETKARLWSVGMFIALFGWCFLTVGCGASNPVKPLNKCEEKGNYPAPDIFINSKLLTADNQLSVLGMVL